MELLHWSLFCVLLTLVCLEGRKLFIANARPGFLSYALQLSIWGLMWRIAVGIIVPWSRFANSGRADVLWICLHLLRQTEERHGRWIISAVAKPENANTAAGIDLTQERLKASLGYFYYEAPKPRPWSFGDISSRESVQAASDTVSYQLATSVPKPSRRSQMQTAKNMQDTLPWIVRLCLSLEYKLWVGKGWFAFHLVRTKRSWPKVATAETCMDQKEQMQGCSVDDGTEPLLRSCAPKVFGNASTSVPRLNVLSMSAPCHFKHSQMHA